MYQEHEEEPSRRRKNFYTTLSCRDCCVITCVDGPICTSKVPENDDKSYLDEHPSPRNDQNHYRNGNQHIDRINDSINHKRNNKVSSRNSNI